MAGNDIRTRKPNPLDDKILQLAGTHSPAEIAHALGDIYPAEKIASRVQELLNARDWLTYLQQQQLIEHRMNKVLMTLEERFLDIDNAKVILTYLKELGARLDKRAATTQVDVDALYAGQARIMAQAINLAFEKAVFALQKRFPDLEEAEVRDAFDKALPAAIEVLDARNAGEAIVL